ncbi:MAG: NDRG family protein [Candidatus Thermoplasmatota archaeon]|nr:NDRG family protein [Candidatus Thermoplasmatota archaeon]
MKKIKLAIREGDKPIQDIGFRLCLLKEAQKQSITHFFAENLPDKKTVEVLVGGKSKHIDEYIETVKKMGDDPERFTVDVEDCGGDIMEVIDYLHFLHTEQLAKGVGAVESLGKNLGTAIAQAGKDFAETVSKGFKHMDDRFDEVPKKVAEELSK